MFIRQKRNICFLLVLLLLLSICTPLVGCTKERQTMRILIDDNSARGSERAMIEAVVAAVEEEYESVNFVIETLPNEEDDRRVVLQRLQTEIMAGKGPDIYVLPGNYVFNTPLFFDVNQAMRNGMFEDLSEYYDADAGMNGLIPALMDAGVVDGKRYVLPMWYDLSVACVNRGIFDQTGFNEDIFNEGYIGLMQAVVDAPNAELAADVAEFSPIGVNVLNMLPQVIDYDTQQVVLTVEVLTSFMEQYQTMRDMQESREVFWQRYIPMTFENYVEYAESSFSAWAVQNRSLEICNLDTALANAAVAKIEGIDMDIIPLTAADGTLTADVTLWGAVGAGCENTELAYLFLSKLLSKEYQWEAYRLEEVQSIDIPNKGWPARTRDGISELYRNRTMHILGQFSDEQQEMREIELRDTAITNEDLPDFHEMIDQAQFSIPEEWVLARFMQSELNDPDTGETLDADINAMMEKWLKDLQWRIAEG